MRQSEDIFEEILNHYIKNVLAPINCDIPKIIDFAKKHSSVETINKGDVFIKQGDTNFKGYYVYKGLFRVYTELSNGNAVNRTFIREGQLYVDNTSYWQKIPYSINAQALEDCVLFSMPFDISNKVFHEDFDFAKIMIEELKQFKIRHENREILLQTLSVEEYYKHIVKNFPELESRIPQYHVASYMGISEVSLSRIKKKILKEQNNA